MIPENLLRYTVSKGFLYPAYLDERDYPWLISLLDVAESYAGKARRDLAARLLEELPVASPLGKRKLAVYVLQRMMKNDSESRIPARKIRAAVFTAAAGTQDHREALARAGETLGLTAGEVEQFMFADLPMERKISPIPGILSAQSLTREANLRMVQALLFRASEVVIELTGNSRAVVRYAKWRGLICSVVAVPAEESAKLIISGPFSLFRRTLLYGKSLSELVPLLASCNDFKLTATCILKSHREPLRFRLTASDRIAYGSSPARRYDSKVEQTFAKDFMKLGTEWDLVREPEPVPAGGGLIFPDFCLQHRRDPSRKWFLEIIGFWTPDYLSRKLEQLERAGITNLILCVDEKLGCAENTFLRRSRTIFYQRKINTALILEFLEGNPPLAQ